MSTQESIPDKGYIADALWLNSFDWSKIPANIQQKITSEKHSTASYGQRMRDYMQWLHDHPQSYNPDYSKRYQYLKAAIGEFTPHQTYLLRTAALGKNCSQGFDEIPAKANIQLPRDHEVKLRSEVGWHFFVGSVWDEDGQEYGVELMFFGIAVLPPALAAQAGLSDVENQIVEMQLGISKAGDVHHQADPLVVAGTSGLLECSNQPFTFKLGKNQMVSTGKDKFFPIKLQAKGFDRGGKKPFEIGLDLEVTSDRDILYQGDNGAMPSIAGMGTLYYSIPNLTLKPGSTLNYGGKQIKLKRGLMWYDHQWGFTGGNPNSAVLRAASNVGGPSVSGWDWYMHQFEDNRQTTVFAMHTNQYKKYYFQSGPTPPPTMTVAIAGKYMDEKNGLHDIRGTLSIDKWIRAETSPNPELYPITRVWHPNHWKFTFDETVPADIREFSMEQIVPVAQTNYFANGAQYNEGAVYLKNLDGKDIGRGFAEAVSYADTSGNAYRLMGFDHNSALLKQLQTLGASWPRRLQSLSYMLTHQTELKQVVAASAGMEFMSSKPENKRIHP